MSIEKGVGYKTTDGTWHADLKSAQSNELATVLSLALEVDTVILNRIMENSRELVAILNATGRKTRERKKKPGRPKGSKTKTVAVAKNNNSGSEKEDQCQ